MSKSYFNLLIIPPNIANTCRPLRGEVIEGQDIRDQRSVCVCRGIKTLYGTNGCFQKKIYILSTTLLGINNKSRLLDEVGSPAIFSEVLRC